MQIIERSIPLIEKALGFKLYEWQRSYLLHLKYEEPEGRAQGRTTIHIVKLLLTNDELIDIKKDARRYQDHTPSGHYTSFFRDKMRMIDDKLTSVGLPTRTVKKGKQTIGKVGSIEVTLDTGKLQRKLRAIAKHTEALADELDAIDNTWQCDCGSTEYGTTYEDNVPTDNQCMRCGKHFSSPVEDELPTRLEDSQ